MPNSWICIDANLVVHLFIEPKAGPIRQLWAGWRAEGLQAVAPVLLRYEVTNALYRYQRSGLMDSSAVRIALRAMLELPITIRGDADLHEHAAGLAERFSLPAAYDAHYLALAERLGAEFWTTDGKLVRAVQSHLPWVHWFQVEG